MARNDFTAVRNSNTQLTFDLSRVYNSIRINKSLAVYPRYVRCIANGVIADKECALTLSVNGVTKIFKASWREGGSKPWSVPILEQYSGLFCTSNSYVIRIVSFTGCSSIIFMDNYTPETFEYTYKTPVSGVKACAKVGNDVDSVIQLSVTSNDTLCNYAHITDGTVTKTSKGMTVLFSPNELQAGKSYTFTATTGYLETWDNETNAALHSTKGNIIFDDLVLLPTTIENLTCSGELYEKEIIVSWRSQKQYIYEYELYYDNVCIKTGNGGKDTRFTIPPNTFTGTKPSSVRVRVKSEGGTYSQWAERSLSLKDIEATISNLIITGNEWEKPIELTWLSENQEQFKIEVFKNNVLTKTYTGTTEKKYTIPKDQLAYGVHTFKVWTGYKNRFTNYQSKDVTLNNIQPTLKNVSLSGSNVDYPISVSWESTDQQSYVVEVWQGDTKKQTYTGTTATAHTINAGILAIGLTVFKVKVAYKDRWTDYSTTSTTLVETLPSIAVFEPDGRIVDRDLPLRVYWTSQNQSRYKLVVDGIAYTGTTAKEVVLPQGQLTSGRKQMTLTVYLDIAGKVKETSKTVEFIVQGKPPMPTITSGATYANNRPTITFDSQDANAYRVEVIGYYDSGWCNGIVDAYKVYTYLPNGIYTIAVSVKNQFNIVSDTAIKQIQINATVPTAPTLKVYDEYKYNTLRIAGTYNHYYVFRNGVKIAKVYGDTFTDYTAQGMNAYSVQGITNNDTFNVSNEVIINNTFDYPILSIDADILELIYRQGKTDLTSQYNPMSTKEFYMGRSKPITRHGEHSDTTYSFDYTEVNPDNYHKLLEMVQEKKPILYRSNKRKIWLSFENIALTDGRFIDYSISAYEIDTNEVIDYD